MAARGDIPTTAPAPGLQFRTFIAVEAFDLATTVLTIAKSAINKWPVGVLAGQTNKSPSNGQYTEDTQPSPLMDSAAVELMKIVVFTKN